jgi:hypothetical protein
MISGRSCAIQNTVSHYSPVIIAPFVDQIHRAGVQKKNGCPPCAHGAALPDAIARIRGRDTFVKRRCPRRWRAPSFFCPILPILGGRITLEGSSKGQVKTAAGNVGKPMADNSSSMSLSELAAQESPLHAIQIPSEIWELAEAIVSRADSPGIENDSLKFLLRAVLYLDRQRRAI